MDKKQTEEEKKLRLKKYYVKNQERIKKYQLEYYHKTKTLAPKRTKIPYYIRYFNRRLVKTSTRVHMLRDYGEQKYWAFIKQEKPLGRHIREQSLFTKGDLLYIKQLGKKQITQ